jgi:HEAT repeat protein
MLAALLVLAALALLLPGSPAYLPNFYGYDGGFYDGHSTRSWIKALNNPNVNVRYRAIRALGAIGPEAGEAVPALATILVESPSRGLRIEASLALTKMAPASRAALSALAQALKDTDRLVRMNAALALLRLGANSRPAIPALSEALKEKSNQTNLGVFHHTTQEVMALALGRASSGSPEAVPALLEALQAASTEGMRKAVAQALGEVGAEARPAASLLRALLKDNSNDVRQTAQEALQKIEGEQARRMKDEG